MADDAARNIIKCGISVERIDLYARLSYKLDSIKQEVHRLASRIDRTGAPYNARAFKELVDIVFEPGFPENATYETLGELLEVVARIFG